MEAGRRSVEGRGKTVDDAILDAMTKLGASREVLEVEVISEGSRGVFGIGAEDARVRAVLKGARPAAPAAPAKPARRAAKPAAAEPEIPAGSSDAEVGRIVLATLLSKMGLEATVDIAEAAPPVEPDEVPPSVLNVTGEDLGVLIGRRGETLRDLQFITRLIVSRKVGHWPNLVVDVEEYRQHREQALTQLAQRMADKVRLTRQPVPLEPMPPSERRIVHIALRNDPSVMTESTGEGEARRVVIMLRPQS
ncbi:MAG TPA: RNA-binding cell elongation regulator Jag/EloR [Anaerolineae bacterium]|nr:RNA-binding cell elongation regulator Jag/EloR [Anaerolineae bacterium]HOQ99158.1 RNA-binding cell elongation regulator Jag/EloR [Anaerolineae bacterium]HPL29958.1 RNA-binding cell elongation regulator Jag/EloR [Anaerolineae bacterium]